MLNSKKRKQFDHPVSLALTTKGMELFLNSKRGYDIFTTLDQKRNYGVQLPQFDFGTLKSLLSGHAVSKVEIPYFSFEQTKEEIPDMTRLFINYIFHQRFAGEVLKLVTDSRVFDHWMDSHKEDRYTYEFFSNPLPEEFHGIGDVFMLNVSGDSMINAGIFDGDKIIVEKTSSCEQGEIVVALIDDSATCKRFYKRNGKIILHPENDALQDIVLDDVSIIGKVKGLVRKF